jgi:hypothetical protein
MHDYVICIRYKIFVMNHELHLSLRYATSSNQSTDRKITHGIEEKI